MFAPNGRKTSFLLVSFGTPRLRELANGTQKYRNTNELWNFIIFNEITRLQHPLSPTPDSPCGNHLQLLPQSNCRHILRQCGWLRCYRNVIVLFVAVGKGSYMCTYIPSGRHTNVSNGICLWAIHWMTNKTLCFSHFRHAPHTFATCLQKVYYFFLHTYMSVCMYVHSHSCRATIIVRRKCTKRCWHRY